MQRMLWKVLGTKSSKASAELGGRVAGKVTFELGLRGPLRRYQERGTEAAVTSECTFLAHSSPRRAKSCSQHSQVPVLGQAPVVTCPSAGLGGGSSWKTGAALPTICPSPSSKLQKGDSPRRKSSRGKCFHLTRCPLTLALTFPPVLSHVWDMGPSSGSDALPLQRVLGPLLSSHQSPHRSLFLSASSQSLFAGKPLFSTQLSVTVNHHLHPKDGPYLWIILSGGSCS